MPVPRDNPYGAFNFQVALGDIPGDEGVIGGFSDVSGLGVDISYSEYRNGNEKANTSRKIPNTHKNGDVTLKRGVIGNPNLWDWLKEVRDGALAPRPVTITLLDEARNPVVIWTLANAQIVKWTGPTLAAKGGGEVAMEEIVLNHEGLEIQD